MKRLTVSIAALALTACASNPYAGGEPEQRQADWHACIDQAQSAYSQNHKWAAFGPFADVAARANDPAYGQMTLSDVPKAESDCMAQKGYTPTARN